MTIKRWRPDTHAVVDEAGGFVAWEDRCAEIAQLRHEIAALHEQVAALKAQLPDTEPSYDDSNFHQHSGKFAENKP